MKLGASAAVTGAAWLGVAVLAHTTDVSILLGASAVAALCAGGGLASWRTAHSTRIACGAAAVILVRVAFGRTTATLVALLLLAGAALRVGLRDLRYGLAAVGTIVALLGRAEARTALAFWSIGMMATLTWRLMRVAWLRWRHRRKPGSPLSRVPNGDVTVIWS